MPKFRLDKLVRDRLPEIYEEADQKAEYTKLTGDELKQALLRKAIEEINEIDLSESRPEITRELSHVQQALADLALLCDISPEQIEAVQVEEFEDKGGFTEGVFIYTIELNDHDSWVNYYRRFPTIFSEVEE